MTEGQTEQTSTTDMQNVLTSWAHPQAISGSRQQSLWLFLVRFNKFGKVFLWLQHYLPKNIQCGCILHQVRTQADLKKEKSSSLHLGEEELTCHQIPLPCGFFLVTPVVNQRRPTISSIHAVSWSPRQKLHGTRSGPRLKNQGCRQGTEIMIILPL
jgi:hypothetical protein